MQQVWLINRKKTWTCSALFGKFPCHCRTSDVLKLYRNGNAMVPLADVSGYFLNPQILLCGFKNFHVHTCPYSNRICRPHVSGFTLSSSANLQSDLRLKRKFYRQPVSLIKLSHETLYFAPMHSNPLPPKPMLCFRPSSLSFTTNNIDLGVGELRCLNRMK